MNLGRAGFNAAAPTQPKDFAPLSLEKRPLSFLT
jgi:hypothetical protein